jgi:hypothetical protein
LIKDKVKMQNRILSALPILLIAIAGTWLGVNGLACAGVATGWMVYSPKRGFWLAGVAAAGFWLIVTVIKIVSGNSQQLLTLAAALANLAGAKMWLLVVVSAAIAFLAGGLGGWLGGSLRQLLMGK